MDAAAFNDLVVQVVVLLSFAVYNQYMPASIDVYDFIKASASNAADARSLGLKLVGFICGHTLDLFNLISSGFKDAGPL